MGKQSERELWIARWIGGFKGYADRELRRASESAFRDYVLERIVWFEKRLAEVIGGALPFPASEGFIQALHAISMQFRDLAERITSVPYAFGEFMIASNLAPDEIERFYACDEEILRRLAALQSLIDPTLTPSTDPVALAHDLREMVEALARAIDARQSAISEYTPAPRTGSSTW